MWVCFIICCGLVVDLSCGVGLLVFYVVILGCGFGFGGLGVVAC